MSNIILATFLGLVLYLATPTNASLTDDDKAELIRAHNFYRSKVQPTATDMVEMVRHSMRCSRSQTKPLLHYSSDIAKVVPATSCCYSQVVALATQSFCKVTPLQ
jgi:hypothetical protein